MKILKLVKNAYDHYYVVVDEVPELTYEKIGFDYVGSSIDSDDNIIASRYLKRENFGNAFGGRTLNLKMKDGTIKSIKDYWFDYGSYEKHGEFVGIGIGTLEELQKCYVYCSYNINKNTFTKMVDEYLKSDKIYDYREVEKWCNLQHKWYDVIVHGKKIPFMMNKNGDVVEREGKKRIYCRENRLKKINNNYKTFVYFRLRYEQNNKLIKIDANYLDVLKDTLPFSEDEIRKNCNLPKRENPDKLNWLNETYMK